MESFLYFIFCVLLLLIMNTYFIYPFFIIVVSKFKNNSVKKIVNPLPISILISVYNGEKFIEERIKNIELMNYDHSKLQVLVGSDASCDKTNEILLELQKKYNWLKVFIFEERKGKGPILNELVKNADNDIIVFTDASVIFDENAISEIVRHFSDNTIGAVCAKIKYLENKKEKIAIEENAYWNIETEIRKAEGKFGIIIGASGGLFAMRKNLFSEIPLNKAVTDDLYISLKVLEKKKKVLYDNSAIAYVSVSRDFNTDIKRKIRTSSTNFQTIYYTKNLIFNRNLLISYAYLSHKILRWFFPFILLLLLPINYLLVNFNWLTSSIFIFQIIFYLFALLGYFFIRLNLRIKIFSIPFFFLYANFAIIIGFVKFLRNENSYIWEPTKR